MPTRNDKPPNRDGIIHTLLVASSRRYDITSIRERLNAADERDRLSSKQRVKPRIDWGKP